MILTNFDIGDKGKFQRTNENGCLKALISIKWFAKTNKKISAYTNEAQDEFYNLNIEFKKKSFMYMSRLQKHL